MTLIASSMAVLGLLLAGAVQPAQDSAGAAQPASDAGITLDTPLPTPVNACQPLTIAMGDRSGWGYNTPGFKGEDFVIRSPSTWAAFWAQHTSLTDPAPPLPPIDFSQQVVIAVVQGVQTSSGPYIAIGGIMPWIAPTPTTAPTVTIQVIDDERMGPLPVLTNPYHIVAVSRVCVPPQASVTFRHIAPTPGMSLVRGKVFIPANATDWVPVANATVKLLASSAVPPQITRSGLDGSYFYLNVAPGAYVLDADKPPYCGTAVTITVPPDVIVGHNFYLTPGPGPSGCP